MSSLNKSSRSLELASILQKYTEKEISEAVSHWRNGELASDAGTPRGLAQVMEQPPMDVREPAPPKSKPVDQIVSKAVRALEKADPEKHLLLYGFEQAVRQGRALATNDELRRLGERLSKTFRSRASRKDNISAVMSLLASRSMLELEELIHTAFQHAARDKSEGYQNLARFLTKGQHEHPASPSL